MTNYEKLKAMSVEEMAEALWDVYMCEGDSTWCQGCVLEGCKHCSRAESVQEFLLQEAEE